MQTKVLFISSDKDLLDYANLYLNNAHQSFVFSNAKSISEAVSILESEKNFQLIYLGHQIKKDLSISDLSKKLIEVINLGKTQFFGTNKAFQNKPWAKYFHEFTLPNKIMLNIYDQFNPEPTKENSYLPFPILSIFPFATYPFDCFVEVKKGGVSNYLKIFKEGEDILYEDLDKYRSKGLDDFFMNKEELIIKIQDFEKKLKAKKVEINKDNLEEIQDATIEFSTELLEEIGIDIKPVHMVITKSAFNDTQDLIQRAQTEKKKFIELINKNDLFYYKHITMTSLLCCYILDELLLTDRKLKEKLCLASNLQNIMLENEQELKLYSEDQLEHFDEKTQERILSHAEATANLLSKHERMELDVLKVIREHHGDKQGRAIPEFISSTSKLSLIFQLSSQFAQRYLIAQDVNAGKNIDVSKIFTDIHNKLESKDQSLITALKSVVLKLS